MATVAQRLADSMTDAEREIVLPQLAALLKKQSDRLGLETPPEALAILAEQERRQAKQAAGRPDPE